MNRIRCCHCSKCDALWLSESLFSRCCNNATLVDDPTPETMKGKDNFILIGEFLESLVTPSEGDS